VPSTSRTIHEHENQRKHYLVGIYI